MSMQSDRIVSHVEQVVRSLEVVATTYRAFAKSVKIEGGVSPSTWQTLVEDADKGHVVLNEHFEAFNKLMSGDKT